MTLPGFRSGYAEINGASLYYEIAGAGHPFVMVHAGIADNRMWNDQFAEFAKTYQIVRFDQRGFGKSKCPDGAFSFIDDLRDLLKMLGIEKTYLMGCSMGGGTCIDYTLAYPDRVAALILVGSGVSGSPELDPDPYVEVGNAIDAAFEAGNLDLLNELEIKLWVDGVNRKPEQVDPAVRQLALDMNMLALKQENLKAERQQPVEKAYTRLSEIAIPTLIIVGDEDLFSIQIAANKLAADVKGAKKVVLHNTAHLPNMEKPAEFNQLVLDFLKR